MKGLWMQRGVDEERRRRRRVWVMLTKKSKAERFRTNSVWIKISPIEGKLGHGDVRVDRQPRIYAHKQAKRLDSVSLSGEHSAGETKVREGIRESSRTLKIESICFSDQETQDVTNMTRNCCQ
jgi:hypothetical protein